MTMGISERKIWNENDFCILLPSGKEGNILEGHVDSFTAIGEMSDQVRNLYASKNIFINPSSSLCHYLNEIAQILDAWRNKTTDSLAPQRIFGLCHGYRICSAINAISDEPNISTHLKELASGNLDFFKRAPSRAKDYLGEIELFAVLKKKKLSPKFEEPDLTISVNGSRVSVACKKIYSEKRLQDSLSNAVSQIERAKRHGLVAINLDDIFPENVISHGTNSEIIHSGMSEFNKTFINKHEGRFRKYMESSRIVACLVSSCVVADSTQSSPRINNHRQDTMWVIPKLGSERQRIADILYSKIIGNSDNNNFHPST